MVVVAGSVGVAVVAALLKSNSPIYSRDPTACHSVVRLSAFAHDARQGYDARQLRVPVSGVASVGPSSPRR